MPLGLACAYTPFRALSCPATVVLSQSQTIFLAYRSFQMLAAPRYVSLFTPATPTCTSTVAMYPAPQCTPPAAPACIPFCPFHKHHLCARYQACQHLEMSELRICRRMHVCMSSPLKSLAPPTAIRIFMSMPEKILSAHVTAVLISRPTMMHLWSVCVHGVILQVYSAASHQSALMCVPARGGCPLNCTSCALGRSVLVWVTLRAGHPDSRRE